MEKISFGLETRKSPGIGLHQPRHVGEAAKKTRSQSRWYQWSGYLVWETSGVCRAPQGILVTKLILVDEVLQFTPDA
jgi:hypothetical protein